MTKGFFITGTDTGVGKTRIAEGLLLELKQQGFRTAALKPIASGCIQTHLGLRNDDALRLQRAATCHLPYEQVNPIALAPPIAPHIAAMQVGLSLSVEQLVAFCAPALNADVDYWIIEGAGGWLVPLNDRETMADLAIALGFPIIFVVAMRLGCLNHAVLTHENFMQRGVSVAGWIANHFEKLCPIQQANSDYLEGHLPYPLLGRVDPVG